MILQELREHYAPLFYDLVMRCAPRKPDLGVKVLSRKAEERAREKNIPLEKAFAQIYDEARRRVERRVALLGECSLPK